MKARRLGIPAALVMAAAALYATHAWPAGKPRTEPQLRLEQSADLLRILLEEPPQLVPQAVMRRSVAVGVFPSLVRVFQGPGGSGGGGVYVERREGGWGAPVFVTLSRASLADPTASGSVPLILVFLDDGAAHRLDQGSLSFGRDVSVSAGPLTGLAARSFLVHRTGGPPEVAAYRVDADGRLASAALQGGTLSLDEEAKQMLHGAGVPVSRISTEASPGLSEAGRSLEAALARYADASMRGDRVRVGRLESTPAGMVLRSREGTYRLSGRKVEALPGEQVEIQGTVQEKTGGPWTIEVKSIKKLEE